MKLCIAREELLRGVSRVQAIVDRRGTLPILTNALLEAGDGALKLAATDLEVGVTCHQAAQVSAPGRITLGAKKLYEIVREIEEPEITLESKDSTRVEITAGASRFSLLAISSEEYPSLPSDSGVTFVSIEGSLLKDMIDRTFYATSTDETRYNLNGIFVEVAAEGRLAFVATDGHRLAKVERSTPSHLALFERGVIVPRKGVNELRKLCEEGEGNVELGVLDGFLLARRPGLLLSSRLIDSEFPSYRQVLPTNQQIHVTIDRERLLRAVRRVALLASDRASGFAFALEDNQLQLSATNPDLGEAREHVAVEYRGDRFQTRFDARYVADALSSIPAKEVVFDLLDELSPAQIRPADDLGHLAIVMPMRL